MTLRRAIKKGHRIEAECPHNGDCRHQQHGKGVQILQCGFFKGTHEDHRGLMVRCKYDGGGSDEL